MDLGKLQGEAVSAARKSAENFEQSQPQGGAELTEAETKVRLAEAMEAREEVFWGLHSIAKDYPSKGYSSGIVNESRAIPVGHVEVPTPSGMVVERNLYAMVRTDINFIDGSFDSEGVVVNFSVEAKDGDAKRGILRTGDDDIGLAEADGETEMIRGQTLTMERYDSRHVFVPAELFVDNNCSATRGLCSPEIYDKPGAERQLAVIDAELPAMRETLDLLHTGIEQSQLQPVAAQQETV